VIDDVKRSGGTAFWWFTIWRLAARRLFCAACYGLSVMLKGIRLRQTCFVEHWPGGEKAPRCPPRGPVASDRSVAPLKKTRPSGWTIAVRGGASATDEIVEAQDTTVVIHS
jgi:hypothetical protein